MNKLLIALALTAHTAAAGPLWVGRFEAAETGLPSGWRVEHLDKAFPPTAYRLRHWDGDNAVEATANKSMAVLTRAISVDLAKTPVLCWRWRVDAPVAGADMAEKSGDDYAARVYLAFEIPEQNLDLRARAELALARSIWNSQLPDAAVIYVWDNRYPVGTERPNANSARARMVVVESGTAKAGRWVGERRDVAADFKRAFDSVPGRLTALAIASDTDDTGGLARAGFADFHFTSERETCAGS
jgi:hypothetical protein